MEQQDSPQAEDPRQYRGPSPSRTFTAGIVIAAVVVIVLTGGLVLGHDLIIRRQTSDLEQRAQQGRNVLVEQVRQHPPSRTLELPASIHGYIEAPIYAKIPGYLKTIYVDKGDRVKAGQVLALLESPETDQAVANARANYHIAKITDDRNQILVSQGVIAQQDADNTHATMLQNLATLNQEVALQAYEIVRAQFDGIITARYVDPGALIPATTTPATGATPIVAMATLSPLRIYAYVPQSLALFVRDGDSARITADERPGQSFAGPVIRHPDALDNASRTMLVEVDLPNHDSALLPGMYAKMQVAVAGVESGPIVRDDALVFRENKVWVPIVRDNRLHLVDVTLGYDNGQDVVVRGDIKDGDLVALNVGQAAREGEVMHPVMANQQ